MQIGTATLVRHAPHFPLVGCGFWQLYLLEVISKRNFNLTPTVCLLDDGAKQEEENLRNNRLALLTNIAGLPHGIADLSVLPGF